MGKGILRLQKLIVPDNPLGLGSDQTTPKVAPLKSIMISPPDKFITNSKRKNKEEVYEKINVIMFHSNSKKPYGNDHYPESTFNTFFWESGKDFDLMNIGFKLVNGINAWVQVNGGPLQGLDSEFGIQLLDRLNNFSGNNATHIINPFYYSDSMNPIKVNRWFVTEKVTEIDW